MVCIDSMRRNYTDDKDHLLHTLTQIWSTVVQSGLGNIGVAIRQDNIPAGQEIVGLAPPRQNTPPGQRTHCDAVALRKEPAGHTDTHAALSGDANQAEAHGEHDVEAGNALNQPDGHDKPVARPARGQY